MTDCLFCGIVAGEVPSRTVYEDEQVQAFLDVNPLVKGHTVVVPKAHHERVGELPADVAGAFFRGVNELTPAVEDAVDATATTVAINNGADAGQEVPHLHCHVVPRFAEDGGRPIHALFPGVDLKESEMDAVADAIGERT
jgi:histidine triad (HIT) family protein